MRRYMVIGGVLAALLTISVGTAVGENVPRPLAAGSTVTELGRGTATESGIIPLQDGVEVVVSKVALGPGQVLGWHEMPTSAVFVVAKGSMVHSYTSCSEKEMWMPDEAHLQLKGGGATLIKNEGGDAAELITLITQVPKGEPALRSTAAPDGCDLGGEAGTVTDVARGAALGTGTFQFDKAKDIAIEHFILHPGFTSTWHRHPGTNIVIQMTGEAQNYQDCKTKELWVPGVAYFHLNAEEHHAHPFLTRNEGTEDAEAMAIFLNVPHDNMHPKGVTPITPLQQPPADCPTMFF